MTSNSGEVADTSPSAVVSRTVGFYAAILTVVITLVTFGLALTAIPISGANCPENCVSYPYLDTFAQYPRDFLWMPPAMLLVASYLILMVAIHAYIDPLRQVISHIALSFALIATTILLLDYYVQFSVVPVSLLNGETDGLPLLIQYNPHGLFLALEELGYIVMSLSFFFVGIAFPARHRLGAAIRWIFVGGFVLVAFSLFAMTTLYGLERLDRFEVFAISVNWLVLLINGSLLAVLFRERPTEADQQAD